ncbi:MAG: TIGR01777 family oxidoreductase [Acidimicrobiales bacterium]
MNVAITGSHGLIGSALAIRLEADGHGVVRVPRHADGQIDVRSLEGVDAVVHLAGVGIGDKRWTEAHKMRVLDSRVNGTERVAGAVAAMARPPALLSASAVGYYGDRGAEELTEASGPGEGYLAGVCVAWERATAAAEAAGARVAHLRTGIVLTPTGGALKKQLLLFKAGLGGRLGSGKQFLSWISLEDEIGAIVFALTHPEVRGAINLTAPNPVTNAEFTTALGRALHRPAFLAVPRPALKLALGTQMAEEMLLFGARVRPRALEQAGYSFAFPTLDGALRATLG